MRLFLLPISTRRSLIYCQRLNKQLSSETTYVDKITTRASNTWLKWEKAEKGWQKRVTSYGNRLFEAIPHEEWGLKSIPPLSQRRKEEELTAKKAVDVVFPGSVIAEDGVKETLKKYAGDERQRYHTKWLWGSVLGMPISAPIALVPVIPNLPFFYLVFRAWSHWRARSGSRHVDFLLDNRLLTLTASPKLDMAYTAGGLDVSMKELDQEAEKVLREASKSSSGTKTDVEAERMLLTSSSGRLIADMVEVPELEEQIHRAVKQVEKSLRAEREYKEEKQELDSVNKQTETRR
ncbi:MAG: hypothetical protein L6R39_003808 [Caloplaca ligustica]|nr:MAG: hypothetical protein L6R39_003808 [Caloplaca ligustica]